MIDLMSAPSEGKTTQQQQTFRERKLRQALRVRHCEKVRQAARVPSEKNEK